MNLISLLARRLPTISRKSIYEGFFTIGGRLLSVLLVIGTTKFLTVFLSEREYGQLSLYNISSTLPSTFFFGPLGQGLMRYFPIARDKNEVSQFHQEYTSLYRKGSWGVLIAGTLAAIICLIFNEFSWAVAIALMTVYNILSAHNTFQYGLQNAARNRMLAMGLETTDRLLQQGLAILLLWLVTGDPLIVFAGYVVSSAVFYFLNEYYYRKAFPEVKEAPKGGVGQFYHKGILQYSWPFFVFGIFAWIQNAADRWSLEMLRSTEEVGQFAVVNQIGFQSLGLLFGSIGYFLFPIMFNRAGNLSNQKQFENANHINNLYLLFNACLTIFLCVIFVIWGKEIISLLSDDKYAHLSYLLPYMVIAGGLFNFGQIYTNRFMLSLQTNLLLYAKIVAAVVGTVSAFVAVWLSGLEGLIGAAVCTQFIYVSVLHLTWKQRGKTENNSLEI